MPPRYHLCFCRMTPESISKLEHDYIAMDRMSTNGVTFSCGRGAVAVALRGPPLEIWWTSWDHGADCFLPWRIFPLPPLFGEVGFLAAGFVANYELGICQAWLVVQRAFSVMVGLLDFENEKCDVFAEISLRGCFPSKNQKKFSTHPEEMIEDCWLVDGPTVLATCRGRMLVASPQYLTDGPAWKAHVAIPQPKNAWKGAKLLYCGNVGSEAVFVSIPPTIQHGHLSNTPGDGSSFSLLLDSRISPTYTTQQAGLMPSLAIPLVKDFDPIRLAHLKPSSITCLVSVPYPGGPCFGRLTEVDLVFGTTDRNLIRWRDGKVAALLEFEEVPSSVYFAVVGGGQGILLVVFKGEAQGVTAVCAETNTKLKSWAGVSGVLVSDMCMWGHDQIVLFPKSKYWDSPLDGEDRGAIVISDLIFSLHLGSGVLLSQSELRSSQELPSFMTDSIWMSLNSRVLAGILEFKEAEVEKSRKLELLRSSCCLIQEMESMRTLENWSDGHTQDNLALQVIRAVSTTQKVYDSTWFLSVQIEGNLPKGTELHNLSLVLTTQHGHFLGGSSTLGSLSRAASGQIIVTSPLMDLSELSSLSVNVLLTAVLSTGGIQEAAGSDETPEAIVSCDHDDYSKPLHLPQVSMHEGTNGSKSFPEICHKMYTQWLCKVEVALDSLSQCFDPQRAIGFPQVAVQQHIVISSTELDHLSVLPAIIKSSLSMVDDCRCETRDPRVLEFVMPPGLPWAQITATLFSNIAVLSLRSCSFRHIVLMEGSLRRSLKNQFKFLPRACAPDISVHVTQFASEFLRELTHIVDGEQMKVGSKRKKKISGRQITVSSLQFVTDRLCSHFLPWTAPTTVLDL